MWTREKRLKYMRDYKIKLKEDIAEYMEKHPDVSRSRAEREVLQERKRRRWQRRAQKKYISAKKR